ncbi:NAD(P)-binding protein [Aaosphaeria arxii CBS 175.79]|uniref:Short-chain dehydrogenase/reductase 3 n=1 Tax=Aaosphaeria arxii CBS 175.79 TaxID=1450172 RepID=A0A6A5XGL5_9PLEO|nr:NAD(P)-binding protein [Aaosphaeria arxii CBS 175.79]KAF2012073.1 NAD(P)-binding protein [Aaosphaeria arxii CBS 175.79]
MPIRSDWTLAREGVTGDTVLQFLSRFALNPALTLPLVLLARYTQKGNLLAAEHASAFKVLRKLLYFGIATKVSSWLDAAVTNNFSNDVYDWEKEVVVVTGGSDGIGKIVVQLLAERGIKVAVLDVQDLTYDVAPPTVRYFKVDLASKESIDAACAEVKAAFGNPTVLVNNAGCARGKTILQSQESDIKLTFNVNTISHYYLAQQFLPSMIERNHGMVVTVASIAGYVSAPAMVDYASSKAAALSFHEGLSAELSTIYKAPKVRTVAICQGYTRTKLFEGFNDRALFPETVAEAIVKAVLGGKSRHIVLPELANLIVPGLRNQPSWLQYTIRKRLVNRMTNWKGRQVVQPSLESKVEDQGQKGAEESTVLVGNE